jgi:hypothetical protein
MPNEDKWGHGVDLRVIGNFSKILVGENWRENN